jgi:uncharacterized protein (DUF2252 family)
MALDKFAELGRVASRARTQAVGRAPLAIVMVVFPIVYYVTHSRVTYRHPIEPEILLLAAYAVVRFAEAAGRFLNVEHRLDGMKASGI